MLRNQTMHQLKPHVGRAVDDSTERRDRPEPCAVTRRRLTRSSLCLR